MECLKIDSGVSLNYCFSTNVYEIHLSNKCVYVEIVCDICVII